MSLMPSQGTYNICIFKKRKEDKYDVTWANDGFEFQPIFKNNIIFNFNNLNKERTYNNKNYVILINTLIYAVLTKS